LDSNDESRSVFFLRADDNLVTTKFTKKKKGENNNKVRERVDGETTKEEAA
jgi:hypothetical protein